jgi:hypothetical protein
MFWKLLFPAAVLLLYEGFVSGERADSSVLLFVWVIRLVLSSTTATASVRLLHDGLFVGQKHEERGNFSINR